MDFSLLYLSCKYETSQWSDCDSMTNTRTRTRTLTDGDPTLCESEKVITKKCAAQRPKTKKRRMNRGKCKYTGTWGPCNSRTNTMTRTLTLKSGDPEFCVASKVMSRKCLKLCRFKKGEWSDCDSYTHLRSRVDTLAQGEAKNCDQTRTLTRKCKQIKCKYAFGNWSDCSPDTNERTRMKKLMEGDPKHCKSEKVMSRSCLKTNGKERCFFGEWGEFGQCTNGVKTKYRKVLQGGTLCERKAVKTRAC